MSNRLKLITGIFLLAIGVIILWETITYNLIDVFLVLGFILAILGIVFTISFFVENLSLNTPNFIATPSNSSHPLKIPKSNNINQFSNPISRSKIPKIPKKQTFKTPNKDNPKAVLNIVENRQEIADFDKKLKFTPNYDKPLKVTRKPRKREKIVSERIPYYDEGIDKTEEIKKALYSDLPQTIEEEILSVPTLKKEVAYEDNVQRDIKIDVNNPDSLPIPKDLRSYVVSEKGNITSKEAFEELAIYARREIMLEIPNLNDLSDRFLSQIPTIHSRIIIEDFNFSDISYIILIASLLKQGVYIKTLSKVNKTNLITDDSHALIIVDSSDTRDMEVGAIYDDRKSISQITSTFDRTWEIASDLDRNAIFNYNV